MKSALLILVAVVVLHFSANALGIYDSQIAAGNVWIDNVLHLLVGLAAGLFWIGISKGSQKFAGAVVFVLIMAITWELCELIFYMLAPEQAANLKIYSPSIQEAGVDVLSNMVGVGILILWKLIRR